MKKLTGIICSAMLLLSCQENDVVKNDFTGNESAYALLPGSTYPISGTVTFKEKKDGSALILVELSGTEGSIEHPVHLHLGSISAPDASVSA